MLGFGLLLIVRTEVHPFFDTSFRRIMHCVMNLKLSQTFCFLFFQHDNEFSLFQCPPQSTDLSSVEHFWDVVEKEI